MPQQNADLSFADFEAVASVTPFSDGSEGLYPALRKKEGSSHTTKPVGFVRGAGGNRTPEAKTARIQERSGVTRGFVGRSASTCKSRHSTAPVHGGFGSALRSVGASYPSSSERGGCPDPLRPRRERPPRPPLGSRARKRSVGPVQGVQGDGPVGGAVVRHGGVDPSKHCCERGKGLLQGELRGYTLYFV